MGRRLPADAWVVTTQKDWVKLRLADLGGRPLWAVRVRVAIHAMGQDVFDRAIASQAARPRRVSPESYMDDRSTSPA